MDRELLRKHFEDMPLMQPTDAMKLVFQHAFGCTHMSPLLESSMNWLRRELEETQVSPDVPVSTSIGGGLCRLNLASPRVHALGAEKIAAMMQASIFHVLGRSDNEMRFYGSLNDVLAVIEEGRTAFSREEWEAFCEWHRENGRCPVGHSDAYRAAYHPSYRVVSDDCITLLPVIEQAMEGRNVIVIDGPCGSGKSTLARALSTVLDCLPIPMDDFFLPPDMRTEERLSKPGGNIHHERFKMEILDRIKVGEPLSYQRFNCQTGGMEDVKLRKGKAVVIEGSYSHHPAFAQAYQKLNALRVFVDISPEEQLVRLQKRNPQMLAMFQTRWIPLEKNYFQAYDSKDRADILLVSQPWNEGL